jgi:hypothetical protein
MFPVHDIRPCTIPQSATAEPFAPAVELSGDLAAANAGRSGQRFQAGSV